MNHMRRVNTRFSTFKTKIIHAITTHRWQTALIASLIAVSLIGGSAYAVSIMRKPQVLAPKEPISTQPLGAAANATTNDNTADNTATATKDSALPNTPSTDSTDKKDKPSVDTTDNGKSNHHQSSTNAPLPMNTSTMIMIPHHELPRVHRVIHPAPAPAPAPKHYVPAKGHFEIITQQVWVPHMVTVTEPAQYTTKLVYTYYFSYDGFTTTDNKAAVAHQREILERQRKDPLGYKKVGEYLIQSAYEESWVPQKVLVKPASTHQVDKGHYETKIVGKKWVIDIPAHYE